MHPFGVAPALAQHGHGVVLLLAAVGVNPGVGEASLAKLDTADRTHRNPTWLSRKVGRLVPRTALVVVNNRRRRRFSG